MYSRDQINRGVRRGLDNPAYFGRELNCLYHRRLYRREFNPRGVDIFAEEWDNLVILDACRFDDFAELHDLPGELQSRKSRGSHTVEFLQGNFSGKRLPDTVYVTASPQFYSAGIDAELHAVENVWDGEGWDEEAGTVRPETMADYTLAAAERYPRKRLIAHFIQPHYPFLGEEEPFGGTIKNRTGPDIWGRLMSGEDRTAPEVIRRAYRRNLELALPAVHRVLSTLQGRTVVTADHGNMFGEPSFPIPIREWGHPPGTYTDQLVTVPWLVHENGRREIERDRISENRTAPDEAESDVEDRLRQLGYVD